MEKFVKFVKQHAVMLSVTGGIIVIVLLSAMVFGRPDHDGRFAPNGRGGRGGFERGMGAGFEDGASCAMHQAELQKSGEEAGCMGGGKGGKVGGEMPGNMGMGGPGMMGSDESKMQEHMCQSGALISGANEHLLVSIDMKINNLELIKKNMQSMAQRTSVEVATGELAKLDDLIGRYDAQRKLLEANPAIFCTDTATWESLNTDLREFMMSSISGHVSKFREGAKGGKGMMGGMMRWFK